MERNRKPYTPRLREPGLEQHTRLPTAEQEAHATDTIRHGIEAAKASASGIDAATARVIAACLHAGYGSHMEHFASTGKLNPAGVLGEVDSIRGAELHQIPWIAALWDFLERIEGSDPDLPETEHTEPEPMVFVQANDPDLGPRLGGRWLHADVLARELDEDMREIREQLDVDGGGVIVSATVGFHDLEVPADAAAEDIARYAEGISLYGEAYACFATHVGYPVGNGAFAIRFEGTYDTITDFTAERASQSPALAKIVREAGRISEEAPEQSLDEYESLLRHDWLILDGRHGVHVFSRKFGLPTSEEDL